MTQDLKNRDNSLSASRDEGWITFDLTYADAIGRLGFPSDDERWHHLQTNTRLSITSCTSGTSYFGKLNHFLMKTRLWLREDCGPASPAGLPRISTRGGRGGTPWPEYLSFSTLANYHLIKSADQMTQSFPRIQIFHALAEANVAARLTFPKVKLVFLPDQMKQVVRKSTICIYR